MVRRDPRRYPLYLTSQDHEVLVRLLRRMSNREIAEALGVREDTVKWHVTCLMRYARERWRRRRLRDSVDLFRIANEMLRAYPDAVPAPLPRARRSSNARADQAHDSARE